MAAVPSAAVNVCTCGARASRVPTVRTVVMPLSSIAHGAGRSEQELCYEGTALDHSCMCKQWKRTVVSTLWHVYRSSSGSGSGICAFRMLLERS